MQCTESFYQAFPLWTRWQMGIARQRKEEHNMKIAFVSMPYSGHLNPMTTLARQLQVRGHEVMFIGLPDLEQIVLASGLKFVPYCEQEYPAGSLAELFAPVSKLHGMAAVQYTCERVFPGLIQAGLKHLEAKLVEAGMEALVLDTVHFFLELVDMRIGVPYVHIWNILPLDLSGATPPCFFSWPHDTGAAGLVRNAEGLKAVGALFVPIVAAAKPYADRMGLQIDWSNPASTLSKLAVSSQTPREFDFPGIPWPTQFHYAGPFHDDKGRQSVPFPWEQLSEKPLVYASLGTVVNGLESVYRTILSAVEKVHDVQVVVSVGNNVVVSDLGPIPSHTIVARTTPQIALLGRAALCVTHAGLNTALESLAQGVPMVAIPIGFDQPGVAARIAHHGVGEFIELHDLTPESLGSMIEKVLKEPKYRDRARFFQSVIVKKQGLQAAADLLERVLSRTTARTAGDIRLSG
jgi:MGT family glycosyltransferase